MSRKVISVFFIQTNPLNLIQVRCENVSYYRWSRQVREWCDKGYLPLVLLRNKHGVYSWKYSPNDKRKLVIIDGKAH